VRSEEGRQARQTPSAAHRGEEVEAVAALHHHSPESKLRSACSMMEGLGTQLRRSSQALKSTGRPAVFCVERLRSMGLVLTVLVLRASPLTLSRVLEPSPVRILAVAALG
jgi:hypothetical protein